jgi:hypothetical protein
MTPGDSAMKIGPPHARLHPDVRYSLDPRYDVPIP